MEELIKYNMHKQYHKSVFSKKKTPQVMQNNSLFFFMSKSFQNTPRRKWEIYTDWENDV